MLSLRVDDVEAEDAYRTTREVVEHRGAVGAVAVHEGRVVLVRQYRHAPGEELLEIPAGRLEPGEDPRDCIARELVEEVGLEPRTLQPLAQFYTTPGFANEMFHLFFTDDLVPRPGQLEQGEVLTVERVRVEDISALLDSGRIRDGKTLVGLALWSLRRARES